jgi:DNA-binding response OmpR family regulator
MSALESLVVVDADPRSRDAVAFGFEREGCVVHATADAREAIALVETGVPQVLVASTHVAGMEAAAMVKAVRAGKRGQEIGVVVIGDESSRDATLAGGADDFLARPAFIRDVVTMARIAAARSDGEVRGQLADYGLFFLTRALSAARQSGVVTLERGRRAGELTFEGGELQGARVGKQNGANAFCQLLLWDRGTLHVRFGVPALPAQKKIQKPVDRLLEDGARFVTEFETVAERVGGPHVVYAVDGKRLTEVRKQVPAEVAGLLDNYDGARTLIDVVEDSPFKPLDTVMITHRLVELGALQKRAETPPSTLSASLAVKDWLLGNPTSGSPVTASEQVGKVVAETLAKGDKSAKSKKEVRGPVPAKTPAGAAPAPAKAPSPSPSPPSSGDGKPLRTTLPGMPVANSPRTKPSSPAPTAKASESIPPSLRDARAVPVQPPAEKKSAAPPKPKEEPKPAPQKPREPAAPEAPASAAPESEINEPLPRILRRHVIPPIQPEEPAAAARPTVPRAAPSQMASGAAAEGETEEHKRFMKLDPAAIERALTSDSGLDTIPFERVPESEVPPVRPVPAAPVPLESAITAPKEPRAAAPFAPVPFEAAVTAPKKPRNAPPSEPLASVIVRPDTGAVPRVAEPANAGREGTGRHPRSAFDALEEEFFAREADLHRVEPVDNFDDLEAPAPKPKPNGGPKKRR